MAFHAEWKMNGFDLTFKHTFDTIEEAREFKECIYPTIVQDSFIICNDDYTMCYMTETVQLNYDAPVTTIEWSTNCHPDIWTAEK